MLCNIIHVVKRDRFVWTYIGKGNRLIESLSLSLSLMDKEDLQ